MKQFQSSDYTSLELETTNEVLFGALHTEGVSILSLFVARGSGTGHCYQPNINYRNIDISYLNCSHTDSTAKKTIRPMVMSHVDKQKGSGDSFDLLAPISLLPYEVHKEEPGLELTTHCCLNIPSENGYSTLGYGSLGHSNAVLPTAQCFAETLAFFGYEWIDISGNKVETIDSSTPPPTLREIIGFASLFNSHSLKTKTDFRRFLKEFGLDALYLFDDKQSLVDNVWMFSQLMRECVSLRFGVFDGQHRMVLMTLFVTGFFEISNCMFLERGKDFDAVFGAGCAWNSAPSLG